jgi:8-oxo-dGTP pyrophosphatase MutT (NUDIX family)
MDKEFGSGKYADFDNTSGERFWGNVGAGSIMYAKSTNRFLINYRSEYVNEPHTYGTIGGKIDDDESPKDAVIREVNEESGYSGEVKLIPLFVFENNAKTFKYYNYLAIIDEEFDPILDWESEGFEWVTFEELLQITPKHPGLIALLKDKKSFETMKKISETQILPENKIKSIVSKVINEMDGRYMFFSNLEQMKRQIELLMELPQDQVEMVLENGHDWAQEHIATAKESIDLVFDFMMNKSDDTLVEEYLSEKEKKNVATNKKLWQQSLAWARSRYKVCPSAYCNGAAVKRYNSKGGKWKKK